MSKAFEIRIELARLGWNTEDRLSNFGWADGYGYSAWVNRWEWHGVRLGGSVSFHASVRPESLTPENIDRTWERLRDMAVAAWQDFPESLPCQTVDGSVIEDESLTRILISVHKKNPWRPAE